MIVHLGIGFCCKTIWECAVGDKNKRSTNGHIMYAMTHPSLCLIQIVTEWGIFRRQLCERWIYIDKPIHRCATVAITFAVVLKKQVPNDLKWKHKTWERPPMTRWESGLSFTTIHRASKCLPQVVRYLQVIQKTNLNAWIRKKPKYCNSNGGYKTR